MKFIEIGHNSPEYLLECKLRDEVLRTPLGMRLADEDLIEEIHHQHFGLFQADGSLIACAIAVASSPGEIKIRQMAVRPAEQGKGHGRVLMTHLMQHFAFIGTRRFTLHARANVTGFYESLGFTRSGSPFEEVGIPHLKMTQSTEAE